MDPTGNIYLQIGNGTTFTYQSGANFSPNGWRHLGRKLEGAGYEFISFHRFGEKFQMRKIWEYLQRLT